jgi:excisionase family DNA binding protein
MTSTIPKRVYTVNEFCETYNLSRTIAYELMNRGRLRSFKIGAKRVIRADDAEMWLSEQAAAAA